MTRLTLKTGNRELIIESSTEHDIPFLVRESLTAVVANFKNMETDVTMVQVQQGSAPAPAEKKTEAVSAYGFPLPTADED